MLVMTSQTVSSCSNKEMIGSFQVETANSNSSIEIFDDSTFIEKGERNSESIDYYGRWRFINKQDSLIELTTEGSGLTEVYTKTPKRLYRIRNGMLTLLSQK